MHYRLYTLDPDGRIVLASDYGCATDREAIDLARLIWASGDRAEIRRGATKLDLALVSNTFEPAAAARASTV